MMGSWRRRGEKGIWLKSLDKEEEEKEDEEEKEEGRR